MKLAQAIIFDLTLVGLILGELGVLFLVFHFISEDEINLSLYAISPTFIGLVLLTPLLLGLATIYLGFPFFLLAARRRNRFRLWMVVAAILIVATPMSWYYLWTVGPLYGYYNNVSFPGTNLTHSPTMVLKTLSELVCVKDGGQTKDWLNNRCCPGLTKIDDIDAQPGCLRGRFPTYTYTYICSRCGNGVCGPGENYCNCPQDCKKP